MDTETMVIHLVEILYMYLSEVALMPSTSTPTNRAALEAITEMRTNIMLANVDADELN